MAIIALMKTISPDFPKIFGHHRLMKTISSDFPKGLGHHRLNEDHFRWFSEGIWSSSP